MILLVFLIVLSCIIVLIRVELIFKYRMKRIGFISYKSKQAIDNYLPWEHLYDEFTDKSFDTMVFTLTKWRYKDFYNDESLL